MRIIVYFVHIIYSFALLIVDLECVHLTCNRYTCSYIPIDKVHVACPIVHINCYFFLERLTATSIACHHCWNMCWKNPLSPSCYMQKVIQLLWCIYFVSTPDIWYLQMSRVWYQQGWHHFPLLMILQEQHLDRTLWKFCALAMVEAPYLCSWLANSKVNTYYKLHRLNISWMHNSVMCFFLHNVVKWIRFDFQC
jgi:hypothetical protein